jgi:recombinational DNA repair protein RecR
MNETEQTPQSARYRYGQVLAVLEKAGVTNDNAGLFMHPYHFATQGIQRLRGRDNIEWAHERIGEILQHVSIDQIDEVNHALTPIKQGDVTLGYYHEKALLTKRTTAQMNTNG